MSISWPCEPWTTEWGGNRTPTCEVNQTEQHTRPLHRRFMSVWNTPQRDGYKICQKHFWLKPESKAAYHHSSKHFHVLTDFPEGGLGIHHFRETFKKSHNDSGSHQDFVIVPSFHTLIFLYPSLDTYAHSVQPKEEVKEIPPPTWEKLIFLCFCMATNKSDGWLSSFVICFVKQCYGCTLLSHHATNESQICRGAFSTERYDIHRCLS